MKKLFTIITIVLMTFLLVSCQNKSSDNEFVIATWAAGTELAEFNEIIEKVNLVADGKYKIKTLSIPSDYYIKLSTQIAAKKAPTFFWLTQELISLYAKNGAIQDLTPYFEASENLVPSDYYEGVLASATYDNKYWGLPWIANPFIVYYNKTMFDALGVETPAPDDDWSWEDFLNTSRQIAGKTYRNQEVFATIVEGNPNIETFIWSGGGDIISADGKTSILDTPETRQGVKNLVTLFREGLAPRYNTITYDRNVWFERQNVAMYFGGIQDDFERKVELMKEEDKFEIGYAPVPTAPNGVSSPFNWTASTVMSTSVKNKELAYEALEALTLAFFDWKIAPPIKGRVENIPSMIPSKANALVTINNALENARSANYVPSWNELSDKFLWKGLYQKILQNPDVDYEDLIDKSGKGIQGILDKG